MLSPDCAMDDDAIPPSSPPCMSSPIFPSSPLLDSQERALTLKSSSPPPLFSSDDSRESIDVTNYSTPRIHKNKRKGTWWRDHDSAHNTPERKRSRFSRNFDSGVFMMSYNDSLSDSDNSMRGYSAPRPPRCQSPQTTMAIGNTAQGRFDRHLQAGLEQNRQCFDFEHLGLEDSDIHQIGDLASVIKNPPDPGQDVPVERQFRSMVPKLYLHLGYNKLYRLPLPLFAVHSLTSLSLRDNRITELPPHISQLTNLRVLDVSLNKLRLLPFEILQIMKPSGSLSRLHTMGNPLLEPMSSSRYLDSIEGRPTSVPFTLEELISDLYKGLRASLDPIKTVWQIRSAEIDQHIYCGNDFVDEIKSPKYMARTLVSFFNQAGGLINGSASMPDEHEPDYPDYPLIVELERGTYGVPSSPWFTPPSVSRVSPLLTVSLHNAFKKRHDGNFPIEDVRNMLSDEIPYQSLGIFERALENEAGGWGEFRKCHKCSKEYVVPRAEWIEIWSITNIPQFVPVKVSMCSWGCVPAKMVTKPERELVI